MSMRSNADTKAHTLTDQLLSGATTPSIDDYLKLLNPLRQHLGLQWSNIRSYHNLPRHLHPVFRFSNFDTSTYSGYYELLYPALQLATAILTETAQLGFWHGMVYRQRWDSTQASPGSKPVPFAMFDATPDATLQENKMTLSFIERMAHQLKFQPSVDLQGGDGECQAVDETGRAVGQKAKVCHGNVISFNAAYIDEAKSHIESGDDYAAALFYFRAATTFLHEFAHAAHNTVFGPHTHVFFGDEAAAEVGFAYENYLFGGIPCWTEDQFYLRNWPCPYWQDTYEAGKRRFGLRKAITNNNRLWLVLSDGIQAMYTADFWRNVAEEVYPFMLWTLDEIATA